MRKESPRVPTRTQTVKKSWKYKQSILCANKLSEKHINFTGKEESVRVANKTMMEKVDKTSRKRIKSFTDQHEKSSVAASFLHPIEREYEPDVRGKTPQK